MAPVHFSLVCFRACPKGYSESGLNELNQRLTDALNRSGEVFLYHTKLNGKIILRLAIGHLHTEQRHIERVQELLMDALRQEKTKHG